MKAINLEEKLLKIFNKRFNLNEQQALVATIKTVDSWDSFTHMDLMLELESEFNLSQLTGEDFANLVSFQKILSYIKQNTSE